MIRLTLQSIPVVLLGTCLASVAAEKAPVTGGPYVARTVPANSIQANSILDLPLPGVALPPGSGVNLPPPSGMGGAGSGGLMSPSDALRELQVASLTPWSAFLRMPAAAGASAAGGSAAMSHAGGASPNGGNRSSAQSFRTIHARDNEEILIDGRLYIVKLGEESVRLYASNGKMRELVWVGYLSGPDLINAAPGTAETFSPPLSAGTGFSRDGGAAPGTSSKASSPGNPN